jgi:HD-like signal output (HDOD) protein
VKLPLARRTLERVQAGLKAGYGASLPELVKLVHSLSHNITEISIHELAEAIERDSAVLARVIGTANTVGYNPSSTPIASLHQAIHLVGFNRVRTLAMSLMLLERAQQASSTDSQRLAAAVSLAAGLMAQRSASLGAGVDPDEAFVCASLRNLGRIALTTFFPEEWERARDRAFGGSLDDACREEFGLTPLELTRQLLEPARLPPVIMGALAKTDEAALETGTLAGHQRLHALTEFAGAVADLAFDPTFSADAFASRFQSLASRYRSCLPDEEALAAELLSYTDERLALFVKGFDSRSGPLVAANPIRLRLEKRDPVPPPRRRRPAVVAPKDNPEVGNDAPESWQQGAARLRALVGERDRPLEEVLSAAIEILMAGFGAPEGVVFASTGHGRAFNAVRRCGPRLQRARPESLRAEDRTVFGICLSRRENVLIHDAADPKLRAYLPEWLGAGETLGAFILLPLFSGDHRVQGLILCGWPEARRIGLTAEHSALLKDLLGLVARSCVHRTAVAA